MAGEKELIKELCELGRNTQEELKAAEKNTNGAMLEFALRNQLAMLHRVIEIFKKPENGEWIPCSERLPEEHDSMLAKYKGTDKWSSAMFEKLSDDVNVTIEYEDGSRRTDTQHTIDGKWKTDNRIIKSRVIAWQPLPEPYKGQSYGEAGWP